MDTLGGGERYILSIASVLQKKHDVSLFWDDTEIIAKTKNKFLLDLSHISLKQNIFTKSTSLFKRLKKTYGLDYFFYISDGSIPVIAAKHVIPIVQFPVDSLSTKDVVSRLKLVNTSVIVCYSEYVKKFLLNTYSLPVKVLYPAVPKIHAPENKENIILSVGRFTKGNNAKNQRMLIHFFKQNKLHFQKWKLILAGSYLPDDESFVKSLKKDAGNFPVEFHTNISYAQLSRLYGKAKIYWHAAGYGKNLEKNPQYAEHFGISVVEAMSAGAVPVVFNGGGLKEIVNNDTNGFVFNTEAELFKSTKELINDSWTFEKMSQAAKNRAEDFSMEVFSENIFAIIK